METQNLKEKVLAYVNNADEKLLKLMEALAETYKKETQGDWWETLTETEKEDINRGIEDVNSGRVIENEEVMKVFEKWY